MKLRTLHAVAGRVTPAALLAAVTALAVAACGGGSNNNGTTPTVGALAATTVNQDTKTGPITFTVSDDQSVDNLVISATTSDASIVSSYGISFAGTGASRTVTITPEEGASGMVNVGILARDAQGATGSNTLALTVTAVNQSILSYTNSTFALGPNDPPAQVSGFTFTQDADAVTTFDPLLQ